MTKRKILILFVVVLIFSACNQGQKSSELHFAQDSVLNRIQQGLSNMPILPRKNYVTIDSMRNTHLDYKQIKNFQTFDESSIAENKLKGIDDLLEMELGIGISALLKISKNNNSFLPNSRECFLTTNGIGLYEKYVSRKTNSVVTGIVIFKTDKEYYTYHLVDTIDFNMNIIGSYSDAEEMDLIYEIIKDSSLVSSHGLKFKNDTIIRYSIIE